MPSTQRKHNEPFLSSKLHKKLVRSVSLQRQKAKELSATKAQLLLYARDLKRVVDRERKRSEELSAAQAQLLQYAQDLKQSLKVAKQQARQLNTACRALIIALARSIEARDRYTALHTDRVTGYALEVARYVGWSKAQLSVLELGGHIHDLGKIGILDAILNKPGRLTPEEFEEMKTHPLRGAEILKGIQLLKPMLPYVLYHHERYDGTGYPYGLRGQDIPEEGRLLSVADAFDAMTTTRPYRKALPVERALDELRARSGTQFDPTFVTAFLEAWDAGAMEAILALGREGQRRGFDESPLSDE